MSERGWTMQQRSQTTNHKRTRFSPYDFTPEPRWPRIHLFRFPRRELVLAVGAVASTWLAARYGMSRDEIVLAAVPVVGGWVLSEVVG